MQNSISIIRPDECFKRFGDKRSAGYNKMSAKIYPPFVKLSGSKTSGLPSFEVDEVAEAVAAGFTEDQLRVVTQRILENRKKRHSELLDRYGLAEV